MDSKQMHLKTVNLKKMFKFELKFYKVLLLISKYSKIYLSIPEMIIYGFGFKTPTLFCTDNRTGELIIRENLSAEAISETFSLFSPGKFFDQSKQSEIPIAVCKTKKKSTYSDKSQLLFSPNECEYIWNVNHYQKTPQIIQKYIRNLSFSIYHSEYSIHNRVKSYQIRKKLERNFNDSFLVKKNKRKNKYLITNSVSCSKSIISMSILENKMLYLVYLIEKYFVKEYNIKILQLKCNWIEDSLGRLFMLNLKEYKIASNYIKEDTLAPLKTSETLPSISFVKKIKDIQKKSQVSVVKLVTGLGIAQK